jgi:hypothetical protein
VPIAKRQAGVHYVLIDTRGAQWPPYWAAALNEMRDPLHYHLVYDREGIQLYTVAPDRG